MKAISVLSLVLILVHGTFSHALSDENELWISGKSIGPVQIGQTKQQVMQATRNFKVKDLDLFLEGAPGSPAIQVYDRGEILLTAELLDGIVYRIRTTSRRLRTLEGIMVGSTFGELKSRYGKPIYLGGGEGGLYAVFDLKVGGMSFRLDVKPEPLSEYVTDQSRVLEILVVK